MIRPRYALAASRVERAHQVGPMPVPTKTQETSMTDSRASNPAPIDYGKAYRVDGKVALILSLIHI